MRAREVRDEMDHSTVEVSVKKKNPASAVCNSSFELLLKQFGTRRIAFDFQ